VDISKHAVGAYCIVIEGRLASQKLVHLALTGSMCVKAECKSVCMQLSGGKCTVS
jgi:hypothetical protein